MARKGNPQKNHCTSDTKEMIELCLNCTKPVCVNCLGAVRKYDIAERTIEHAVRDRRYKPREHRVTAHNGAQSFLDPYQFIEPIEEDEWGVLEMYCAGCQDKEISAAYGHSPAWAFQHRCRLGLPALHTRVSNEERAEKIRRWMGENPMERRNK